MPSLRISLDSDYHIVLSGLCLSFLFRIAKDADCNTFPASCDAPLLKKSLALICFEHLIASVDPAGTKSHGMSCVQHVCHYTASILESIAVSGIDKAKVGKVAAEIRSLRGPEPYKGKGIKYEDETIRRKVGKSGGKK